MLLLCLEEVNYFKALIIKVKNRYLYFCSFFCIIRRKKGLDLSMKKSKFQMTG